MDEKGWKGREVEMNKKGCALVAHNIDSTLILVEFRLIIDIDVST